MSSVTTKRPARAPAVWHDKNVSCTVWSSLGAIEGLCKVVRHALCEKGANEIAFITEIVARELMNNAVFHGNEGNENKQFTLEMAVGRDSVRLRVTDDGPGFDWRRVPKDGVPVEQKSSGRGLAIIRLYSQRISYNKTGNQITVWLKKSSKRRVGL